MHNILICSANEDLLTALRAASGGGDVHLTVCRRGMEAVRALVALSFDRLILDLETPGLDGLFLVSIARRIDPHLPVVAVSRGPVVQARAIQQKGITNRLLSVVRRAWRIKAVGLNRRPFTAMGILDWPRPRGKVL
jgi:CheY-like chemotaxis protein